MNPDALNSATKYPSIQTYHGLDPSNGNLTESEVTQFPANERVVLTEKIDGTNGRIIVMPDGDWYIGSREELLYARGDRIGNPSMGIVSALRPLAQRLYAGSEITVYFLEVYGGGTSSNWKQYAAGKADVSCRLFDIAQIPESILSQPREQISGWREHGGQQFLDEMTISSEAFRRPDIQRVPQIASMKGCDLPQGLRDTLSFLKALVPATRASLTSRTEPGRAEGIVLRTVDRSVIAKARFEDYERTLRKLAQKARAR